MLPNDPANISSDKTTKNSYLNLKKKKLYLMQKDTKGMAIKS